MSDNEEKEMYRDLIIDLWQFIECGNVSGLSYTKLEQRVKDLCG